MNPVATIDRQCRGGASTYPLRRPFGHGFTSRDRPATLDLQPRSHCATINHRATVPVSQQDTMQVRIKGYAFQLAAPYAEGDRLTKGEAQALNGLRAENVQNNLRRLVNEAVALAGDRLLTPTEILSIQSQISEYDAGYTFGERTAAPPRRGDLELAAREIATETVAQRLREQGVDASPEEVEELVAQVASTPAVLEAAHARATAKRKALVDSLNELLED